MEAHEFQQMVLLACISPSAWPYLIVGSVIALIALVRIVQVQRRRQDLPVPATDEPPPDREADGRLDRLMTYTTFHIGVYVTLAAGVLATSQLTTPIRHWTWTFSMLMFLLAGACGGAIAGNISELKSWEELTKPKFWLSAFTIPLAPYHVLAMLEHAFFWLGILVPVIRHLFDS